MKKSNILAHRGLWKNTNLKKNSPEALFTALELGFGIETDIRDGENGLEIRHDPFEKGWNFEELLIEYQEKSYSSCLALNIKSDGLANSLSELLIKYQIKNYFTFDMSIPDHLLIDKKKINNLIRISEYEPNTNLFPFSIGYWIDPFQKQTDIKKLLSAKKINKRKLLVYVSPELHGHRLEQRFISSLTKLNQDFRENSIFICTDVPEIYIKC